jgi:hypothetical protein
MGVLSANELRIGNWVTNRLIEFQADQHTIYDMACFSPDFRPIPLTEEWLVKFGFVKDGKYDYLLKRDGFEIWNSCDFHTDNGDKFLFIGNMPDLEMRFIHVHQLQNLYFALTGEEL